MKKIRAVILATSMSSIFWLGNLSSPAQPVSATTTATPSHSVMNDSVRYHNWVVVNEQKPQVKVAEATVPQRLVNGHPVNDAGFVTDGSPQLDDAHCVGDTAARFACLEARHPGLSRFLQAQWDAAHPVVYVATIPRNSTEACIVQNENGGSYAFGTNPSHMGRYQFAYTTWVANGGNPNTWGSGASPAEQDQVFINTVAHNGYRDWTPYDGC